MEATNPDEPNQATAADSQPPPPKEVAPAPMRPALNGESKDAAADKAAATSAAPTLSHQKSVKIMQDFAFRSMVGTMKKLKGRRVEVYRSMPYALVSVGNESGILASRAGFLAGFSYYELSRSYLNNKFPVWTEPWDQGMPYYVLLLLGTFALCLTVVVRDVMLQRMFRQIHTDDLPKLVDECFGSTLLSQYMPCLKCLKGTNLDLNISYHRFTSKLFWFAWFMYIAAQSFMLDVWNPSMHFDNPALYHSTRYLPVITILICLYVQGSFGTNIFAAYCHGDDWPDLDYIYSWGNGWRLATQEDMDTCNDMFAEAASGKKCDGNHKPTCKRFATHVGDPEAAKISAADADYRLSTANAIGGRALMILGFVGAGLARYRYVDDGADGTASKVLNKICWVSMVIVCMCMVVAVHITTKTSVYLKDFEFAQCREHFARKTRQTWLIGLGAYRVGMLLLFLAAGVMGWGNSFVCNEMAEKTEWVETTTPVILAVDPHVTDIVPTSQNMTDYRSLILHDIADVLNKYKETAFTNKLLSEFTAESIGTVTGGCPLGRWCPLGLKPVKKIEHKVPDGACYAHVAYVPAAICSVCFLIVVVMEQLSKRAAADVIAEIPDDKESEAFQIATAKDLQDQNSAQNVMAGISNMGNSATICAGFVVYNIATFDSDVIRGPFTTGCGGPDPDMPICGGQSAGLYTGLNGWGHTFLWANWFSFAFGITAALTSTGLGFAYETLKTDTQRRAFVARLGPLASIVAVLFRLSLVGFMAGCGLFGLAKMDPYRVESAACAIVGLIAVFTEIAVLDEAFEVAQKLPEDADLKDVSYTVDPSGVVTSVPQYQKELGQLNALAPRALMFGGFAYNGVSFLFRPDATFAGFYVTAMSLCFNGALYLTLVQSTINQSLALLKSEAQKERFVQLIPGTLTRGYAVGVGHLLLFLSGFVVMGYIKLWTFSYWVEAKQVAFSEKYGWLQLAGGIVAILVVVWTSKTIGKSADEVRKREESDLTGFQWKELLQAINAQADATTFQAGNVFYEILFGAINENLAWATYIYFIFSVLTLVAGTISVSLASQLSYWISDLPSEEKKSYFAFKFRNYEAFLTLTYILSVYFWLCAMLVSSAVKYTSPSFPGEADVKKGTEAPLWWVSFGWCLSALIMITYSIRWISAQQARYRRASLADPLMAEKERVIVILQRMWRLRKKRREVEEEEEGEGASSELKIEEKGVAKTLEKLSAEQSRKHKELLRKQVDALKQQQDEFKKEYKRIAQAGQQHWADDMAQPIAALENSIAVEISDIAQS